MHRPDETASLREDLEHAQAALKRATQWHDRFVDAGELQTAAGWADRKAYWERAVAQSQRALDAELVRVAGASA